MNSTPRPCRRKVLYLIVRFALHHTVVWRQRGPVSTHQEFLRCIALVALLMLQYPLEHIEGHENKEARSDGDDEGKQSTSRATECSQEYSSERMDHVPSNIRNTLMCHVLVCAVHVYNDRFSILSGSIQFPR